MSAPSIPVRLQQMRWEAQGIASYELVAAGTEALPAFTAGAHIDLRLPQGSTRSYSLVNAPSDSSRYVIAVQREADGRGGSAWLHTVPRVGDRWQLGAPVNDFELADDAQESVFIAGGFEVLLQRSGQRIAVPVGKTILDTLLDHAVEVQYACSAGVCGTCLTPVLEGIPEHRDDYLTDQEKRDNRSIMVCCSGSRTPTLVLDL